MQRDRLNDWNADPCGARFVPGSDSEPVFVVSASLGHDIGASALEIVAGPVERFVMRISVGETIRFSYPFNTYLIIL